MKLINEFVNQIKNKPKIKKILNKLEQNYLPKINSTLYFISNQVDSIIPLAEETITIASFLNKKNNTNVERKIKKGKAYIKTIIYSVILIDKLRAILKASTPTESTTNTKSKFEILYEFLFKTEIHQSPNKFKFEILGTECIDELIRTINNKKDFIEVKGVYKIDFDELDENMVKPFLIIPDKNNLKYFHIHCSIDKKEFILYVDGHEMFINAKKQSDVNLIIETIRKNLIKRALDRKNSKKNYFTLKNIDELVEHPRRKVLEKISQVSVEELKNRIYTILKNGRKQGSILVGKPGTGKSLTIKKLEELILEYPFLYLEPHHFDDSRVISNTFSVIKLLQPVIVIMEDLDAFGFKSKNPQVGSFINQIDDINNELNAFFIATVNNTKNVHRSIIERPGRFDYLLELLPPSTAKEVYDISKSKFDSLKIRYKKKNIKFPLYKNLDNKKLNNIAKLQITQAHISFLVVEKMFLELNTINSKTVNTFLSKCLKDYDQQTKIMEKYKTDEE